MKKVQKRKTFNSAFIVIFLVLMICRANAQTLRKTLDGMDDIREVIALASWSRWDTLKQDMGVTLSSRWLSFGDSLQTREIASHFIVQTNIQNVLVSLMEPEKMLAWNDGIRSLKILSQGGTTWITHSVYDIPQPLSQQDLVIKNMMIREGSKVIILQSSMPEFIEPMNHVTRQKLYFGKWELTSLDNFSTDVHFSAISFSKSGIPRFIRDPIIQNKMFNSFLKLKELSSDRIRANTTPYRTDSSQYFFVDPFPVLE